MIEKRAARAVVGAATTRTDTVKTHPDTTMIEATIAEEEVDTEVVVMTEAMEIGKVDKTGTKATAEDTVEEATTTTEAEDTIMAVAEVATKEVSTETEAVAASTRNQLNRSLQFQ